MTKKCSQCNKEKQLDDFYNRSDYPHRKRSHCKECMDVKNQAWVSENKEKMAGYCKQWRKANPEKQKELSRQWAINHPERLAELKQKHSVKYRERRKEVARRYSSEHLEQRRISRTNYKAANPNKIKAQSMVHWAVKSGRLAKAIGCKICGESKVEAHHYDYNYPLEVVWLCSVCHKAIHRKYNRMQLPREWLHPNEDK